MGVLAGPGRGPGSEGVADVAGERVVDADGDEFDAESGWGTQLFAGRRAG